MSVCKFIAADIPLYEVKPSKDYPTHIDIDKGTIDDDGDEQILNYMKETLEKTEYIELWKVWLMDYFRPSYYCLKIVR